MFYFFFIFLDQNFCEKSSPRRKRRQRSDETTVGGVRHSSGGVRHSSGGVRQPSGEESRRTTRRRVVLQGNSGAVVTETLGKTFI